ncbi:MAG: hypothetical protein Q8R67_18055 [Rhodoferax sp.]|nr:hypothetical protein [Rhodoferax sp.]MDP3653577.1 hypothetical protein [Rhodoferax sp.]
MNNPFQLEQQTHAALAQYYRWYQVYEVPFTAQRIANQKDILSDDVEIVSQMGASKGKNGLEDRLKVFTGWQNAHHVQNTAVTLSPEGKLLLEADIVYQNIRPDHSQYSYTLHYSTRLQARDHDLPVFERLELKPTGEVKPFKFEAAYAENRAKSFMHYWLYLMETAHTDSGKFKELLAKDFSLQLSDGPAITQFAAFEQWLASIPGRVRTSTHAYSNFQVVDAGDNRLNVSVDFDWKGITPQGQAMVAQTHHEWVLTNTQDERFARMQSMQVTLTKPYQLAP